LNKIARSAREACHDAAETNAPATPDAKRAVLMK
jgi:hypothetical protein